MPAAIHRANQSENPGIRKAYSIWKAMRKRCNNPNSDRYKDYGARGITVAVSWNSFERFLKDMGPCSEDHSIERIKNGKGYCKSNCRWIPLSQQVNNTRRTIRIQYQSKIWTLKQLCSHLYVNYSSAQMQYTHRNWTLAKALKLSPDNILDLKRIINDK